MFLDERSEILPGDDNDGQKPNPGRWQWGKRRNTKHDGSDRRSGRGYRADVGMGMGVGMVELMAGLLLVRRPMVVRVCFRGEMRQAVACFEPQYAGAQKEPEQNRW